MLIAHRPTALAYRCVAVVLIALGIARVTGVVAGDPSGIPLLYYTTQSNILCLAWMIVQAVRTGADLRSSGVRGWSSASPRAGGAVMMAITVTMLIYLVILLPQSFAQPGAYEAFTLTDNLVHIVTPLLVIVDWLAFAPKGRFRWVDPLLWTLIPYAYLTFAFPYGAAGGDFGGGRTYPYPFMNVAALGIGGVVAWIAGLTIALVGVGFVYLALDRMMGRVSRKRVAAADLPA